MKKISLHTYLKLLFAVFLLLLTFGATGEVLQPEVISQEFFCYALDHNGETIKGHYDEIDDTWYLFVPSAQDISKLRVRCTGEVISASDGEFDCRRGILTGAFTESGDRVGLSMADGEVVSVVVMQSELPSVQITLHDASLDDVHANKEVLTRVDRVRISDLSGSFDKLISYSAEIRGRGNTTWTLYDKKAYQLNFDSKLSILGMNRAKRWVLLANSGDDSMIRTQLVYRMAKNLDMEFVSSLEFVDLWVNGEYLGTYLMGEKVEIDSERLNLTDASGTLFEHDGAYYIDEEHWFYNEMIRRYFTVKEVVVEDEYHINKAVSRFTAAVDELMLYLYSTPSSEVTLERLSQMIDVDSFAKYFLVNEYVLNCESYATSFYWYQDGADDVLHMGPVWDFDTCMGNDMTAYDANYGQLHTMFAYLLAAPEFYERIEELFELYCDEFYAMEQDAEVLYGLVESSAKMNYIRWRVLGTANSKTHAAPFCETYEQAVLAVRDWLVNRREYFRIPECRVVTSVVSEDFRTMDVYLEDDAGYNTVRFAVWNYDLENAVPQWCEAELLDGAWRAKVDLTKTNSAGMYRIDAYINDAPEATVTGRCYVSVAVPPDYPIEAILSGDETSLYLSVDDTIGDSLAVAFAVWSDVGAQDDILWFDAVKDSEGKWTYTVDMTKFSDTGLYLVHAFGNITGYEYVYLNDVTVMIGEESEIETNPAQDENSGNNMPIE